MTALQLSDGAPRVGGTIKGSKHVQVLSSRTCDFTDAIQVQDVDVKKWSWIIQVDQSRHTNLENGSTFWHGSERAVMMGAGDDGTWTMEEEALSQAMQRPLGTGKGKGDRLFPRASGSLADTLTLAQ